jgi:hypothetical protein
LEGGKIFIPKKGKTTTTFFHGQFSATSWSKPEKMQSEVDKGIKRGRE